MRVKKIIPLFVFFAMVISLFSVPAHATYGGGIGRADLWEWTYGLYQSGNTDFNPGGIYGGGGGRDDLSAVYSSYVSTLDSTTASSFVAVTGFSVGSTSQFSYVRKALKNWVKSSATNITKLFLNLGVNDKVFVFGETSSFLYGAYWDDTGKLVVGQFTNPRGAVSPLWLGVFSLSDLELLEVGSFSNWQYCTSISALYYSASYASSSPNFASSTVAYFDPSRDFIMYDYDEYPCFPCVVSYSGRTEFTEESYAGVSLVFGDGCSSASSPSAISWDNSRVVVAPSGTDATTRPTSITGNYGIIGDDGQLTSVGTQTIVIVGISTYYNPVTSTTYDLSGWTYDYSTRTYDLSTTSGDTITVEYADESVNITEGDTVYNVYYVVEQEPVDPSTCEHTYTCEHTTLPSCTQAGLDTYTCSLCGDTYTQTVAAAGHAWTVKQSVNTQYDDTGALVTEGYTIYECSTCGEQYKSTDGTSPPNSSGSSSGGTIGGLLEARIGGLGSIVGGLISGLLSLLTKAVEALGGIGDLLSALWDSLGSIFDGFTGFLAVVFPFLPEEFLTILEFGFILLVGAGIIKKFSS